MKKTVALTIFLAFLITFAAFPVSADGTCPVNYSCYITHDGAGTPTIHFDFINTSNARIVYAEYSVSLYDRSFQPAMDTSGSSSLCRIKISNLSVYGGYTLEKVATNLSAFPTAAHVGAIKSLKIQYEDGTTWEMQGIVESKADFICKNLNEGGAYLAEDGQLYFCDSSIHSEAREWYYWDNARMDWVLFGTGLEASLPAKGYEVSIKIVINCDPNNYCIKSLIMKSASIAVACKQNSEIIYSNAGPLCFHTHGYSSPFEIAVWDFNECISETWYIWNDTEKKWIPFSNERGPELGVETKAKVTLKAVYNNDENNYKIYIIYFI